MVIVQTDTVFYNKNGVPHRGFYMDANLKSNIDNYFIKAVDVKWDCVVLNTGMEGSAKTTSAAAIAHYIDPTFPGELIGDGSPRRHIDRVVFTFDQLIKAIDNAKPKQAIQFDEAVMAMNAQDASSEIQKILIKKMTMIRKKQLFIFILIPKIFMLRRYFAVSRARAMIHMYTPDGISRGYFRFYNYEDKRKLYFKGFKEWDDHAAPPSFKGRTTDTSWYFYDENEYEKKKDEAIEQLTAAPQKAKKEESEQRKSIREARDKLIFVAYHYAEKLRGGTKKFPMSEFSVWLKANANVDIPSVQLTKCYKDGRKLVINNATAGNQEESGTEFTDIS